jgi:DNA-binding transcriptional MerR regulator
MSQRFTISELAKEFATTARTIRFYEEKGLIHPLREGQHRLYSSSDRTRLKLILRGKRIGLSLEECREIIDMYDPMSNNSQQLQRLLAKIEQRRYQLEQQLNDIKATLQDLAEVERKAQSALSEIRGSQHAKPL